jgi:hypothetical protein
MTDSAIDRLKERQRKKVPKRSSSLNASNYEQIDGERGRGFIKQSDASLAISNRHVDETNESDSNQSTIKINQSLNESNQKSENTKVSQSLDELHSNDLKLEVGQSASAEISQLSVTQPIQLANDLFSERTIEQEPIRRTIRLEPKMDDLIDSLCKLNKVTRETLFEAAIEVCSQNQRSMSKVVTEAQKRYAERKRTGEIKKLQTMNKKFQMDS